MLKYILINCISVLIMNTLPSKTFTAVVEQDTQRNSNDDVRKNGKYHKQRQDCELELHLFLVVLRKNIMQANPQ